MKLLILDSGMNQTAYLAAELARAGIEATLAAPRLPDPGGLGRYAREIQSPDVEDAAAYAPFVEKLLRDEHYDLLLPTIEPLQHLAWALPPPWAARVFPAATAQQRALLADRRALSRFVAELGVPVPRELPIDGEAQLDATLRALGLPCVLRGTQGLAGQQVKICAGLPEAQQAYRELLAASPAPPFAQEHVDGRRCLIGGLFDRGRMLHWFSQTTLESCPAPAGPSVRVRSRRDPVLTDYARRIFDALAWDGLACAEFILRDDGSYRFLEVNPRPWAAIQAAHVAGVPLLRLFAAYLLGRKEEAPTDFADGVDCTLFPAFFTARIRSGDFPRLRDLGFYAQSLAAAPWSAPPLLRSFLRLLWWTYDAQRHARRQRADRTGGAQA